MRQGSVRLVSGSKISISQVGSLGILSFIQDLCYVDLVI